MTEGEETAVERAERRLASEDMIAEGIQMTDGAAIADMGGVKRYHTDIDEIVKDLTSSDYD